MMEFMESFSPYDTFHFGEELGKIAVKGQLYCLNGDLGVGKTVFSQGFAKGLLVNELVNSPTFTIIQEYLDGRLPFYHFDVYRITSIEEMEDIGYEEYFYGQGVCMIEWADLIQEVIPKDAIKITISKDIEKGFDYRFIKVDRGQICEY